MNETHHRISDEDLDRLVDGELTDDEYRRLLLAVEEEPDGWRRCAAAFLEAQAWAGELRSVRQSAAAPPAAAAPRPTAARGYVGLALAAAASFAIAFVLGWQFRWSHTPQQDAPALAGTAAPAAAEEAEASRAADPGPSTPPPPTPWGEATLVMDRDDGSSAEINLPVFQYNRQYTQAVEEQSAVPPDLRRRLRRRGLEVRGDVKWSPIEIEGGGRMLVPMREVEIRPSSREFH